MDQDRWKTINHIFHAALEVPSDERSEFVQSASNGDADLQAEVELLLKADLDAGSYLETPLLHEGFLSNSVSGVNPGDVLCGRFCILKAVGEGGMGQVFEAFDSELAVHVALKVIRPEIAANPEALARFRQEVRLARRITHPNVCRTFDIERETRVLDPVHGTKQELVFLTMEFLHGETLASRIKQAGALPLIEALHVARQTSDALQTANALGIVHRDIKPANIMLVPVQSTPDVGFRAVIMDFGLAHLDPIFSQSNLSVLSHTSRPIGTLAYMAPEQLEGTAVSPATDIYAFGLILFEMVTGARAFTADNLLSGIALRLSGRPPSPKKLVPGLPTQWCRAIEGCLRLRPEDRFQSVAEVISVLDGSRGSLPRVARRSLVEQLTISVRFRQHSILVLALLLSAVVALFVGGLRLYLSRGDSKVAPGALVYLTQVKNQTTEKTFDGLTELIQAGLTQSAHINVLDQGRAGEILRQMTKSPGTVIDEPTAREIALRAGAPRVIFATVTGSNGSYTLSIDIQQPDVSSPVRYRDHWTKSFPWQTSGSASSARAIPSELLTTIRNSSDWIRKEAGESANDIASLDAPPEDVTTDNWNALADYVAAEHMNTSGNRDGAVIALKDATALDPSFSLAQARLGDILLSIGRNEEGYEIYQQALNSRDPRRLTRRERDRIRGIYASDTRDYETAESAFRDYTAFYGNDYLGWFYQALPLKRLDRIEESVTVLQRAVALKPESVASVATLADCLIILGKYQEASRWLDQLRKLGYVAEADWRAGDIAFLNQRYDDAEAMYRSVSQAKEPRYASVGSSQLARLFAEEGRYDMAITVLGAGISRDKEQGNRSGQASKLMDIAYLNGKLGNYEECIKDVDQSIKLESSPNAYIAASTILGRTFQYAPHSMGSRFHTQLLQLLHSYPNSGNGIVSDLTGFRLRGEVLLASGDYKGAILAFEQAQKLDAPAEGKEYLARAFAAAARGAHNKHLAQSLKTQARDAYAAYALRPGYIWDESLYNPPGILMDVTGNYLHLAAGLGEVDTHARIVLQNFARLRPDEFSSSPDLQRALGQLPVHSAPPIH